jgi:chemotaxis signal transduction protein
MTTMVHFRSGGSAYCLPVDVTRGVRRATGLVRLPAPARDVAGIVPGEPPLTVIAPRGSDGEHVLVLEAGGAVFGLLVDTVTGLRRIAEEQMGAAPAGQDRELVRGTVTVDDGLVLVADPVALAGRL